MQRPNEFVIMLCHDKAACASCVAVRQRYVDESHSVYVLCSL